MTEEPEHIKQLRAKLGKIEKSVELRRKYLQLDDVMVFKSGQKQFADRPLRFKKLRFAAIMSLLPLLPKVEPIISVDEKGATVEVWPDLTPEQSTQYFEAACQGLAAASVDKVTAPEFVELEPTLVVEAFKWLLDISGYSAEAIEDIEWFRRQTRGAASRGSMLRAPA